MSVDYKLIGKRIQQKRKQLGKTQEAFAEDLSVSVSYVSQFERGKTKLSLNKLSEISVKLNCDLSFLVSGVTIEYETYAYNELLNKYFKLEQNNRKNILDFMDVMINNQK